MITEIMSTVIPFLGLCMFVFVFGVILFTIIKSLSQSRKNAASPRISAPATLVSKRYSVRVHNSGSHDTGLNHAYNHYYMTFEFESGDRMEFSVPSDIYGLSAEGDKGKLLFQGTSFIRFERES